MWPDNRALLSYGRKRTLQINKLIVQRLLIVHQLHQSFYFFTTLRHYHMTWRPHALSYKQKRTLSFGARINSSALKSTCVSVCIHTYNITIRDAMNEILIVWLVENSLLRSSNVCLSTSIFVTYLSASINAMLRYGYGQTQKMMCLIWSYGW